MEDKRNCTDDQKLANEINSSFLSVMQDYVPLSTNASFPLEGCQPIIVDELSVANKLTKISSSKAGGPDRLPNWVLKEYAFIIAPAVTDIINTSFQECTVPTAWKLADVTPIPKARSIKDFNKDLRPVSLTSTLSKVAESFIIERELKPSLLKSMDPQQYGFIPQSCTTFALLSMIHNWLKNTDGNGSTIRVCLLDYRKAFDLIDHNLLITKLSNIGISRAVINWIVSFLTQRHQRVKISADCLSTSQSIPAGIAQGTKIGPWLFLAAINDLRVSSPQIQMWKFADDTTVSEVIPKGQPSKIQQSMDEISLWSTNNLFQINGTKCKELTITFRKDDLDYDAIKIQNNEVDKTSEAKILGLTITDNLKWNSHIDEIVKKSSKRIYLLKQLKLSGVESSALIRFYCACIRSVLEYSCQVFHSSLPKYLTDDLERIQRRSLRVIYPGLSYKAALTKAELPTLEERRESLCNKLYNQIEKNNSHKLASILPPKRNVNNYYSLRRSKVYHLKPKTDRFKNSFIVNQATKCFK